jgi:hypothetical protein
MYLRDDPDSLEWNYLKFSNRADIHWVPQEDGSLELTMHVRIILIEAQNLSIAYSILVLRNA